MIRESKILITGGAGFIGSHLAEVLCKDNDVTVLDNLSSGKEDNLSHLGIDYLSVVNAPNPRRNRVLLIHGDVKDVALVKALVYKKDYVFHLAANVGNIKSIENPIEDMVVNVRGTLNLLEACKLYNIKKFVYSSSSAVYGDTQDLPIKEIHTKNPESPYGLSKYVAEQYVLLYHSLFNVPVIALRYFNVYGTRQGSSQYANAIPVFFRNMKEGKITIFGDGEQTRDFVNVKDVVDANMLAAKCDLQTGVFNIASGSSITVNELVKIIKTITKANPEIAYADRRKGEVLHSLADMSLARKWLGYEPKVKIGLGLGEYYKEGTKV